MNRSDSSSRHAHEEERLFLSLPIERHFMNIFSKYRDAHGRIPYLTWTPEKKLHITLLFIGAVPVHREEELCARVREVIALHDPFALTLEKVSYAPPERRADMVWAYFAHHEALDALAHDLHHALVAMGLPPADSFKNGRAEVLPHITLARFKKDPVRALIDLRRTELEGKKLLIEDVELVRSRSTPKGSMYTVIETISLRA